MTPNTIIKHIPTNKNTHTYLAQLVKITLVLPNRFNTKGAITTPQLKIGFKHKLLSEPQRRCNLCKLTTHPQTNPHQKPKSHPKCNPYLHKYTYHLITTRSQPYNKHNYGTKSNPQQSQYAQQNNKMAPAYRPRHKGKPKYLKLEKWTLKTIIKHPPTNKSTHHLTQLKRTTSALPNYLTTQAIIITQKIHIGIHSVEHKPVPHLTHKAHSQYIPYPKHKPHIKYTPNPQTYSYQKSRRHPNHNSPTHKYIPHLITTKKNNIHHPKPKPATQTHNPPKIQHQLTTP